MIHKDRKSFNYFHPAWELVKETYVEWRQDNAPQLGAALAFYTIFSLAPLFIIIIAVIGYFLGKESVQIYMVKEMTEFIGKDNALNIMMTIEKSHNPGSDIYATIVAFLIMLFGSSLVVVMLKDALNTMWGAKKYSSGIITTIKNRIISHNRFHKIFCFLVRRDPVILFHGFGTCIIGRKRQLQLPFKALNQFFQISGSSHDILLWIKGVFYIKPSDILRHNLHQTRSPLFRHYVRIEIRFGFDDGLQQRK